MFGSEEISFPEPEQLVRAAGRGDSDAFAQLFLKLFPVIEQKVAKLAPHLQNERDDLIQEGAIGLMDAVSQFDPARGTPFQAFASVCIENRILSALRSRGRQKNLPLNESVSLDGLEIPTAVPFADPEGVFFGRERLRNIAEAVNHNLSDLERKVLESYLDGRSYREIASRLGMTEKSVDNALQRIRRKLSGFV